MRNVLKLILMGIAMLTIIGNVYGSGGGIDGYSQTGCTCHDTNPGPGTSVVISGLPGAYDPGKNYSLTVTVTSTDVTGSDGGFDLSVTAGTLVVTDATNTRLSSGEIIHTSAGNGQRSWSFNWTAPGGGDVTFYVAGQATNGAGAGGDYWAISSNIISIIPEFTGVTLLLVLAATAAIVLLFSRKRFIGPHQ